MIRLLRLLRVLPLWLAVASWLTGAGATLALPGCGFKGGSVEGCQILGRDISGTIYDLASGSPYLLAVAVPWFAVMSLVIALVEPRRT